MRPLLLAILLASTLARAADAPKQRPNMTYILADDMGSADAGFNGGTQIRTPNLDRLAKAGTILSSFYGQPLAEDLGEKNNLAASEAKKLAEMKEHLERLLNDAVSFPTPALVLSDKQKAGSDD